MPEIICTKEAESGQKGCNNDSATGQHAVGGAVTLAEERKRRDQQEGNYKKAKVTGGGFLGNTGYGSKLTNQHAARFGR